MLLAAMMASVEHSFFPFFSLYYIYEHLTALLTEATLVIEKQIILVVTGCVCKECVQVICKLDVTEIGQCMQDPWCPQI